MPDQDAVWGRLGGLGSLLSQGSLHAWEKNRPLESTTLLVDQTIPSENALRLTGDRELRVQQEKAPFEWKMPFSLALRASVAYRGRWTSALPFVLLSH
jgi:hypothetical protein